MSVTKFRKLARSLVLCVRLPSFRYFSGMVIHAPPFEIPFQTDSNALEKWRLLFIAPSSRNGTRARERNFRNVIFDRMGP